MNRADTGCQEADVVEAIESNFYACARAGVAAAGREADDLPDLHWVRAWPARMHSMIYGANLTETTCESRIGQMIKKIEAGLAPRAWITAPGNRPGDLGRRLECRGFALMFRWAGMAAPLDDLILDSEAPEDCRVTEVRRSEALHAWAQVVNFGLFRGTAADALHVAKYVKSLVRAPGFRFVLGTAAGEPVAAAMTYVRDGIAGLYCVATRADVRRRGYGRAVVVEALRPGRQAGARLAILHATEQGEPLYRGLGFEKFCEMNVYRWPEEVRNTTDQKNRPLAQIREIHADEAATVADLLRRGFRDVAERFDFTRERCPTFPAHIAAERIAIEAGAGTRFFLLEAQGEPRGCVGLKIEGAQCWMVRLAVPPEYRHQGYGRDLAGHVEREAWRMGFGRVDIAVVAENDLLCAWYHRMGYTDRESQRFDHLPFTVVYMVKEASNG